jgi:hypothetical protein
MASKSNPQRRQDDATLRYPLNMPEAPQRGQQRRKPRFMESYHPSSFWAISPDPFGTQAKI